jgi:cyclopropane fatty-acyl-phospholipid synthase-like methyltransferase
MSAGSQYQKNQEIYKSRLYDSYISSYKPSNLENELVGCNPQLFFSEREHQIRRVISKHVNVNRDARILDLGCGNGAYLHFLQAAGYRNIAGADVSSHQVAIAHQLGIVQAECSDILPYLENTESDTVDAVLLIDVLEHLTLDQMFHIMDNVFRVLRSGGQCLAHVPNAEGLYGMRVRYGDLTHERAFSPPAMNQLFTSVGFSETRCFEDQPDVHGLKSLVRAICWKLGTLPHRLLLAAETGASDFVLSQNMLATARKL